MLSSIIYMYLPKGKDATPLNIPLMPQSLSLPGQCKFIMVKFKLFQLMGLQICNKSDFVSFQKLR